MTMHNLVRFMPMPNVDGTENFVSEASKSTKTGRKDSAKVSKRNVLRQSKKRNSYGTNKRARKTKKRPPDRFNNAVYFKKSNNSSNSNIRIIWTEDGQFKIVEGDDNDNESKGKSAGRPRTQSYARNLNGASRKNKKSTDKDVGLARRTKMKSASKNTVNRSTSVRTDNDKEIDERQILPLRNAGEENPIMSTEDLQESEKTFDVDLKSSNMIQNNIIAISTDHIKSEVIDVTDRRLSSMIYSAISKNNMNFLKESKKKWDSVQRDRMEKNQSVLAIGRKKDCKQILQSKYAKKFWETREQTLCSLPPGRHVRQTDRHCATQSRNNTFRNYSAEPQRSTQVDRKLQSHSRSNSPEQIVESLPISTRTRNKRISNSIAEEKIRQSDVEPSEFIPAGRAAYPLHTKGHDNFETSGEVNDSHDTITKDSGIMETLIHELPKSSNNKEKNQEWDWQTDEETVVMKSANWEDANELHTENEEETIELASDGWNGSGVNIEWDFPINHEDVMMNDNSTLLENINEERNSSQSLTSQENLQIEPQAFTQNFAQQLTYTEDLQVDLKENSKNGLEVEQYVDHQNSAQLNSEHSALPMVLDVLDETPVGSTSRNTSDMSDIIPNSPLTSLLERFVESSTTLDSFSDDIDDCMLYSVTDLNAYSRPTTPSTEVDITFEDCLAYSQQSIMIDELNYSQIIPPINKNDVSFQDYCSGLYSITTTPRQEMDNPLDGLEYNPNLASLYPLCTIEDAIGIQVDDVDNNANYRRLEGPLSSMREEVPFGDKKSLLCSEASKYFSDENANISTDRREKITHMNPFSKPRLVLGPTGLDITLQESPVKNHLLPSKREEPSYSTSDDNLETIKTEQQVKKPRHRRSKWSNLELETLEKGMEEYGTSWAKILDVYGKPHGHLRNRTSVQLKDKARNEKLRRTRENISPGIFDIATDYCLKDT
ncbi:9750_t:CDS:2 [Acaulospora morrowiae]|uniref:9750_t:CDS:1 n=1 Tax=Acaulospora morrowiae TaxID=94023 RepID=A0A9N9H5F7_9GLOM|nr:9750_t:CDS:2 [Acaulospora morrowiae]